MMSIGFLMIPKCVPDFKRSHKPPIALSYNYEDFFQNRLFNLKMHFFKPRQISCADQQEKMCFSSFLDFQFFNHNSKTELPIKLKSKIAQFWFFDFFWIFFRQKYFFLVKIYKISDFAATVVAIWAIIRYLFFHNLKKKDFGFSI